MSAFNYCSGLLSALLLASLLVVTTAAAPGISCRDESGKPVDWWYVVLLLLSVRSTSPVLVSSTQPTTRVIFKVPHLSGSSDPNAASGTSH
jgi:hypothetical protein